MDRGVDGETKNPRNSFYVGYETIEEKLPNVYEEDSGVFLGCFYTSAPKNTSCFDEPSFDPHPVFYQNYLQMKT